MYLSCNISNLHKYLTIFKRHIGNFQFNGVIFKLLFHVEKHTYTHIFSQNTVLYINLFNFCFTSKFNRKKLPQKTEIFNLFKILWNNNPPKMCLKYKVLIELFF